MSETCLLRCPFCGRMPELRHDEDGFSFIVCANDGCYTKTDGHLNDESAIKTWNNRKPMQNILERLETLFEKAQHNTEKASGLGDEYEKHMTVNSAKAVAYDTAIRIIKEEGAI